MFNRPVQAVAFALDYQRSLKRLNANEGSARGRTPAFEVGDEGQAPLKPPPWFGNAHREVPFWRRAATLGIKIFLLLLAVAVPARYLLRPTHSGLRQDQGRPGFARAGGAQQQQ